MDLAYAGAARLATTLAAREVSSRELTELFLGRIERFDPQLNAFRTGWPERALAAADEADRAPATGADRPLLGVPIAIKDTVDVAGAVTARGSAAFDTPAATDSVLVQRLREAGCVIVGKTNLPELAIHGFTESAAFGVTRNPWDPSRTPGGSSGGAAAAVSAGLVPLRIAVSVKPPRAVAPPLLGDESRQAVQDTATLLEILGHTVAWRDPDWGSVGNQIAARYLGGIAAEIDGVPDPRRLEPLTRGYRRLTRAPAPGWAVRRALRLESATGRGSPRSSTTTTSCSRR